VTGGDLFGLEGNVVIVTGGGGLLGEQHGRAIVQAGGYPVLLDIDWAKVATVAARISEDTGVEVTALCADVTDSSSLEAARDEVVRARGRIDGLVNNAALDTKVSEGIDWEEPVRLEQLTLERWNRELAVGLTGAFLCSRIFGSYMAGHGGGVIVNVSSDLGILAPDQRLYRQDGVDEDEQPVKPVTYSVVKHGTIGLTRYLATYWTQQGVRCNCLCPGGVRLDQPDEFVQRIEKLIPLARMARADEYHGALVFLLSPASAYMNGHVLTVDGGRSVW
jgi:NAD(P)-dependent dehydrogenase (short-subunit alcohol dehydrogenase family)